MFINFGTGTYETRIINIPGLGTKRISTESLKKALNSNTGHYVNVFAKRIDDLIFCFVPDEEIDAKDADLQEYLYRKFN